MQLCGLKKQRLHTPRERRMLCSCRVQDDEECSSAARAIRINYLDRTHPKIHIADTGTLNKTHLSSL